MKISRLIIIAFLVCGTVLARSGWAAQQPSDCVVCGHACCCPEMCKPIIEKMKKEAASHCGVSPERQDVLKGCNQSLSVCGLAPKEPVSSFAFQDRSLLSRPLSVVVGAIRPEAMGLSSLISYTTNLDFLAPIRDVLTPPPEFVPS